MYHAPLSMSVISCCCGEPATRITNIPLSFSEAGQVRLSTPPIDIFVHFNGWDQQGTNYMVGKDHIKNKWVSNGKASIFGDSAEMNTCPLSPAEELLWSNVFLPVTRVLP